MVLLKNVHNGYLKKDITKDHSTHYFDRERKRGPIFNDHKTTFCQTKLH